MFSSIGSVTSRLGASPIVLCNNTSARYFLRRIVQWLTFFHRRRAEIPIYSFAKHAREKETTSIYSPHVLILEGIFALYDPRVLQLLDMKVRLVSTDVALLVSD